MRQKSIIPICIVIICTLLTGCITFGNQVPKDENADSVLSAISENEKKVIQELFVLSSEIELLNTELEKIGVEIEKIKSDVQKSEGELEKAEVKYATLKENLKEVLKIEQRSGVASSLDIILSAQNIKDLVNRINLLRDLSKNVDSLIEDTEVAKNKLTKKRNQLHDLLNDKEEQEALLVETMANKTVAKQRLEDYLSGLASEKAHYEAYLKSIETQWNDLKPLFKETMDTFTQIIETGDVPADTAELSISLVNPKGIIRENKFNQIMGLRDDLPELTFDFKKEGVSLFFPSHEVVLNGYFELIDNQTIEFIVTGGEFYGLPMSSSAIKDLFSEGSIVFKLKSLIGKNKIKKIMMFEDRIELLVSLSFF